MKNNISNSTFHAYLSFLLSVFLLISCNSNKTIVNSLEEPDANQILVLLASKGIDASKTPSTTSGGPGGQHVQLWDIQVPADKAVEAMQYLNEAGLPKPHQQNLLQIFGQSSLVPSNMQEKIRYEAGLAQEIANTIRKIDGILDANVIISYPPENPLTPYKSAGQITASVFVKHNGVLNDPNLHLRSKIKRLVSASVTGLDFDNVTVVGERAESTLNDNTNEFATPASEEINMPVKIWTVTVAQDSVFRFRVILFALIISILVLILLIIWIFWKIHLIIKEQDAKKLFDLSPWHLEKHVEPKEPKTEESPSLKQDKKGDGTDIEDI